MAPPTPATFDELAHRVAAAEPRRGSIVQPPPAWEPDEVTLGFAMISDESGTVRELPEPIVLATILTAVESDRRHLINRITGGSDEEVVAVASLFWPLLILRGRTAPEVAIFDGTGVWKRTFRYTLLPPLDTVRSLLTQSLPPAEELTRLRSLVPYFGHDPGAEVLTVEGFLPVDPPLLFDVLAHSQFRSDPQSPHSGFLPARHEVQWYHEIVERMQQWLDRFESDVAMLGTVRERVHAIVAAVSAQLDAEYLQLQQEARARVAEAIERADAEAAQVHANHRRALSEHMLVARNAMTTVAHGETAVTTSEALGLRAAHRRTDTQAHTDRGKQAQAQVRQANRQIAEARRAMEFIHAQERADLERIAATVAALERQYAQALAERELFRDEFLATGGDVSEAIDGQIAARTTQKNLLAGYFLPLPSLAAIRVVWFPLWMATLRGPRGIRQVVFPPMQVRSGKGIAGRLKQLFGGVVLPLEPRTAQFDRVLRATMEESLVQDPWLSTATQELTRASDVLADPDVLQRLQTGLRELGRAGWITQKHEQEFLNVYLDRARRRAEGTTTTTAPPLAAAVVVEAASPGPESAPAAPGPSGEAEDGAPVSRRWAEERRRGRRRRSR
ncbi:MAG TPA: hypothetical protein VFF67_08835 [Thermoplasmata archaeon]|nr:hypothetical protein [Thermoplasmata archaeon]